MSLQSGRVVYFIFGDAVWHNCLLVELVESDECDMVTLDGDFGYDVSTSTTIAFVRNPTWEERVWVRSPHCKEHSGNFRRRGPWR